MQIIAGNTYRRRNSERLSAVVVATIADEVIYQQRMYGFLGAAQTTTREQFLAQYFVPQKGDSNAN